MSGKSGSLSQNLPFTVSLVMSSTFIEKLIAELLALVL